MQLDRFTEKAQEAILAAQQLAERLQSPVLDAEHVLSTLIEPDDGVPAETLRRLGVDLPTFRGELSAILAKRAKIQGGSLTLDPRAKRVIDRAKEEARRLGDEYVSTEHLLLGIEQWALEPLGGLLGGGDGLLGLLGEAIELHVRTLWCADRVGRRGPGRVRGPPCRAWSAARPACGPTGRRGRRPSRVAGPAR